jgi:hypothetical protein
LAGNAKPFLLGISPKNGRFAEIWGVLHCSPLALIAAEMPRGYVWRKNLIILGVAEKCGGTLASGICQIMSIPSIFPYRLWNSFLIYEEYNYVYGGARYAGELGFPPL